MITDRCASPLAKHGRARADARERTPSYCNGETGPPLTGGPVRSIEVPHASQIGGDPDHSIDARSDSSSCWSARRGRGVAEAERLQDAVEVQLREPAREVADPELVEQVLDLGGRQVDAETAQQALQSREAGDAATAGEAAEELAEQALAGLRVDRDDHGIGVGLAVEV